MIGRVGMALGSWRGKKTCRKYGGITRHAIVKKRERKVSWKGVKRVANELENGDFAFIPQPLSRDF
jgi:hypothetical protein